MFSLITRLLLISLSICFIQSYKLNVPKVLLPFHSSKLISFTLEAKSETESASSDEICFNWSSSRPDVVTITPIYTDSRSKCSNKAVVSAVSKHPQRLTSIIFAHETKTDKLIRCDVIVDQINQIRIKHTTTHLYLEDSPECFTAEALDDEGNTFSSIDGLAFEWRILNDDGGDSEQLAASVDSRNVLKISKFIDSEYEVSDSIKQLESVGLTGHKILIEGLKTGQANVQAKLVDPFYKSVLKSPLVRLLVVANLLLEPSYPVYLVPGAEIKYTVSLIKQHSVEKISLPGSQYYFESRNSSIADLAQGDKTQSVVVAKNLGTTDVVLIDRNMREEMLTRRNNNQVDQQLVVPPPSATIHVVTPDHLVFSIKNWRSWILEVGRRYEIVIQVVSTQRMQIYSSDNLVIESQFDAGKFGVNYQSSNGSYNYVAAREKGVTVARASLKGTRALLSGEIIQFDWVARGEQEIELLDPIDVIPKIVIFALKSSHLDSSRDQVLTSVSAYEYRLQASGGSGTYYWQSKNTTIASVSAQGLVRTTATKLGQTTVTVTDVRNTDIQSKSIIYVLEPVDLAIQACPVETQVGSKLYLNIQMNAYVPTNTNSDQSDSTPTGSTIMPITDCSRLPFDVSVLDESVFKFISIQSPTSTRSTDSSCAIVVLDSLRPGRTTIKLSYAGSHISDMLASNEIQIGSYSMLKSHKTLITLAKDSSLVLNLYDGPLFSSLSSSQAENAPSNVVGVAGYQSDVVVSDRQLLDVTTLESESHAQLNRYSYVVKCKGTSGDEGEASVSTVKFSLSHKKSPVNRCPLAFDYKLKVRCADPTSLELTQLFVNNEENTGNVLSTMKWKCPIKQSSHVATAHSQRPLFIQLTARDSLGNVFDNFTSLKTEWQIGDRALLDKASGSPSIESFEVAALDDSALMLLHPNEDVPNSNRLFYQRFQTKSAPIGSETKIALKMFITDEKVHTEEHHKHKHHHLSGTLNIRFVSDVRIEPETLTVFNHPSNIIPLGLSRGSGHYQAEIETALDTTLSSTPSSTPAAQQLSPALKINQINENSVVVSPSANNGLTYLNVYDYCVPPAMPKSLDDEDQGDQDARRRLPPSIHRNRVLTWPPYATAKIHVAGINSILVNYEDDKVQVKNGLKVYVQISDATGNLIRTKYFPLMNLRAKLANVESNAASNIPNSAVSGQQTSFQSQSKQDLSLATIELDQSSRSLIDEFTAVYVLNGLKKGVVSVQFEAQSDGYDSTTKRAAAASISSDNLIQSGIKDIQIYGPLRVQPKYIELIRGAQYQVLVSGGPVSLDATISYEVVVIEKRGANSKADAKIIDVDASKGLIDALELGKVKVGVKSIGHACQPFSAKAATQSPPPPSRCTPESKIVRVYSEDTLIVNVVELRSVQIHAPLRSIKRGNEMPVYLMANEKSLSALNFASSPSLKYHWRLNDPQIGELYHPLIEDALGTTTATSESDESYGLFEKAFSLRLLAKQSGSVKISVRVEFLNSKNQLTSLTDSIDIQVFDEAQFTHFAPSYFSFKHPLISKSSKSGTPTINTYQLLMSPGTQLQVRTNFDNLATKISYELKFYQASNLASGDDQTTSSSSSIICSNSTIRVNNEGLLIATGLKHLQIKNFQECTATLLVTVLMASGNGETKLSTSVATKQQTLAYTVRVKPVVYSMLKLNRNSIAKLTETVKFKLSRQSLIKNRLQLNSGGVQMKWHVRYYDNLGDTFDVVNTNNLYAVNRHDLVDFSNMNTNLFELTAQSYQQQQQAALNTDGTVPTTSRDSVSESIAANDKSLSSISMVANAVENSFTLRTIERGMFIMELTPLAAKRSESSRDYIGLNIGSLNSDFETTSAGEFDSIAGRSRIEANLGDLICLTRHDSSFQDENDDSSSKREHESETQWTSQVSNVVKLISSDPWTQIGVCVSSGHSNLRKSTAPPHDSLLGLVEVAVRPLERVRFLSRSVKHISNAQSTEVSNSIQFQVVGGSPASQNCSAEFENALKANSRQQEQFNPFKCSASLFTESGRRLAYLDRLLTPTVAFSGQYWFCEVKFVPESQVLMYDLIENHIDRPLAGKLSSSQLAEEFSRDNEPALIVIQIGSKSGEEIGGFDEDQSNSQQRAHSLPFVPAFFTTTKQIELLICGSRIGAPNRRIAGLSDSGSHDHVQLIIHATHSLRSHLILTSNCPTLIKIKEHDSGAASQQSKPAVSSSGASTSTTPLLSLTYEVSATDDVNDLNTFASLLQQLKGEIYVQVTCSLTQQIERIPVRFVFGAGLTTADAIRYSDFRSRTGTSTRSNYAYSFWYNPLGYILDLTPSQTSSFLVLLIVSLLTLLVVLRFWSPASSSTQQIAMNAQAAAAATAAAMISQQQRGSPKDHSSFNPYRYFSSSLDQVPNMDYNRSPSPHSFRRMPMSPQNANESYYATPRGGVFTGSPTKPPVERDSIRLFSTDANVFVRPRQPQDNTMNLSFRNNASRTYNDTSFSDHE